MDHISTSLLDSYTLMLHRGHSTTRMLLMRNGSLSYEYIFIIVNCTIMTTKIKRKIEQD
ncbi:hypothetical protein BDV36DRAFT_262541 [Aspergillus pseudocaelatus]|uniref:Uncharacterized protein n=1 Tax=Aspergillus pseudocaelatus TaxID=1825620 RepID=A0ABQ6WEI0_9EURO|nr:hypothetical protein BDV36DRAFT_262541 [Aspergillus pseudocaelatus]